MNNEIDTIKSEHNFFGVADPLPINPFDEHDLHVEKHQEYLDALLKEEETGYRNQKILVVSEHIALHKEFKKNKSKMHNI